MFAILCNKDNLEKIVESGALDEMQIEAVKRYYIPDSRDEVFITGYVNRRGRVMPWAVLPMLIFKQSFDYDPIKIQTDWDIIVRLP